MIRSIVAFISNPLLKAVWIEFALGLLAAAIMAGVGRALIYKYDKQS